MKASTLNLDLSKVEAESTSMFSKVPDGDYVVYVAHAQFKEGKKAGAAGLQVGYMIEEGPQKGKMVQDYINIMNENDKAVEIGHRRLKLIMTLQNRKDFKLKTDMDLINRGKFMISTVLEKSTYNDKEMESVSVKKLFALENAPAQTESAASKATGVTKTATKPAAAPVVEDAEVAEEGNDDVPPWMK